MPQDYPDYCRPVDIIRQTIEKLAVDIVSQTLEKVNIDIVAQTLAELGIDIKAQTLAEVITVINPLVPTASYSGITPVPAKTSVTFPITAEGGRNLYTTLWCNSELLEFHIEVDGAYMPRGFDDHFQPLVEYEHLGSSTSPGITLNKYDTAALRFCIQLTIPYQWKSSLRIIVYNPDTVDHAASVQVSWIKAASSS